MGCDDKVLNNTNEIIRSCDNILKAVEEKSKEEVNPLLIRIQRVILEFQDHYLSIAKGNMNPSDKKYHWSVLYRAGDMIDEMTVLLRNTTPVFIQTEVEYIKQSIVFFTNEIVQTYGRREALFIITPKFQELAGLWK